MHVVVARNIYLTHALSSRSLVGRQAYHRLPGAQLQWTSRQNSRPLRLHLSVRVYSLSGGSKGADRAPGVFLRGFPEADATNT